MCSPAARLKAVVVVVRVRNARIVRTQSAAIGVFGFRVRIVVSANRRARVCHFVRSVV
jgi:hypothetical protein